MKCNICNFEANGKKFSNHLKKEHKLKSKQYTIDYIYSGVKPSCIHCGNETRYVAFSFKKYCKNCSSIASKAGGRKGGKAIAWNKGLTKEIDERIKKQSESMSCEGNHFYGKTHTKETKRKISISKTLARLNLSLRTKQREKEFTLMTSLDDYFSRQRQYLEFKCNKCNKINNKTLQAFERGSLCEFCFPLTRSKFEIEIGNFLKEKNVVFKTSDRSILKPKELDIVVEDKKLAIEANGLYWHSEFNTLDKNRHLDKTIMCIKNEYSLLHFFNDEWYNKTELCKSMIMHRLKLTDNKIFARKCNIITLTKSQEREFFDKNHISGSVRSKCCFGLEYDGEIVSALSLRSPLQKKYKHHVEIARFATKVNTVVVGGLSKILKKVIEYAKENSFDKILTYADRRFGEGNGYLATGFEKVGNTGLDYWYTDGQVKIDRFSVRAKDGKSEREIAIERKIAKVYGCGSNIYIKDIT